MSLCMGHSLGMGNLLLVQMKVRVRVCMRVRMGVLGGCRGTGQLEPSHGVIRYSSQTLTVSFTLCCLSLGSVPLLVQSLHGRCVIYVCCELRQIAC